MEEKSTEGKENRISPTFWRNKRVLLTGHTGFKGSWLSVWLDSLGAKVSGIALPPDTTPNMFDTLSLKQIVDHHVIDIRDAERLSAAVKAINPDIVFHLAAQPIVKLSYENPVSTFATNIMGTANVLEAARACRDIQSVVVVTSDKCYRPQLKALKEDDYLGGLDPYSASKSCAEIIAASYRHSFFSSESGHPTLSTVRSGNIFGGGDWGQGRLVVDAVQAFSRGNDVVLRRPDAVRPWLHVLDSLRGYLILAEKGAASREFGTAWNLGCEPVNAVPVIQVAQKIAALWQNCSVVVDRDRANFKETELLMLDWSAAKKKIGWQPLLTLDAGLKMTVDWYQEFYRKASSDQLLSLTLRQIEVVTKSDLPLNIIKEKAS